VYRVARNLLAVPAVLLLRNTARDAELLVLRHTLTSRASLQQEWSKSNTSHQNFIQIVTLRFSYVFRNSANCELGSSACRRPY
jgi:hypothetical protein